MTGLFSLHSVLCFKRLSLLQLVRPVKPCCHRSLAAAATTRRSPDGSVVVLASGARRRGGGNSAAHSGAPILRTTRGPKILIRIQPNLSARCEQPRSVCFAAPDAERLAADRARRRPVLGAGGRAERRPRATGLFSSRQQLYTWPLVVAQRDALPFSRFVYLAH